MKAARIKGALVGVESVTPDRLKDVYKVAGESLIERLRTFRRHLALRRYRTRLDRP